MVERVRITPPLERVRISDQLPALPPPREQKFGEAGPGRPRGSRNILPARVARELLESWDELGEDGKGAGGLRGFLRNLFWRHPQLAAPLLHKMIPAQVMARVEAEASATVEHTHTHRVDPGQLAGLTTDELAGLYRAAVQAPAGAVEEPGGSRH